MTSRFFDYIIIGSGMGGSAAAFALTQKNKHVLLLEAGGAIHHDAQDWDGKSILVQGRYKTNHRVSIKQYSDKTYQPQPQEEALGGKTMFYGGACFRYRKADFQSWDLDYQDFEPWYQKAEDCLEIHGDLQADPGLPDTSHRYPFKPIAFSDPAQRIAKAARDLKLKPFPIPLAINRFNPDRPQCSLCNTCDGFPCKIKAKNDAVSCFLDRAKNDFLTIKTHVVVDKIEINRHQASQVLAYDSRQKKSQAFQASKIIIAGGAIGSAGILLRSQLKDDSSMLGKNLMRHCNAIVGALFPFKTNPTETFHKQVAIMDYYDQDRMHSGLATGIIQDIYMPPAEVLPHFLPTGIKTISKYLRPYIQNLLCVSEDAPQLDNQVMLSDIKDASGIFKIKVAHQYLPGDQKRNRTLIKAAKRILLQAGALTSIVRKIDSFSHAVGTLRFGQNSKKSVLDLSCRVHGLNNVFVLDGSFMPSSGGVNPSLTIAANALRVCDILEG